MQMSYRVGLPRSGVDLSNQPTGDNWRITGMFGR